MYKTIVNPETGRKVKVNGKIGQKILNNYKKQYGGMLIQVGCTESERRVCMKDLKGCVGGTCCDDPDICRVKLNKYNSPDAQARRAKEQTIYAEKKKEMVISLKREVEESDLDSKDEALEFVQQQLGNMWGKLVDNEVAKNDAVTNENDLIGILWERAVAKLKRPLDFYIERNERKRNERERNARNEQPPCDHPQWQRELKSGDECDFKNLMFKAIDQALILPFNQVNSIARRSARNGSIKHSVNQLFTNTQAGKYREDFELEVDNMKDIFNILLEHKDYSGITDILLSLEETSNFLDWDIKEGPWKQQGGKQSPKRKSKRNNRKRNNKKK